VAQVGTLNPGRDGSAVRLRSLLKVAGVREHATPITFSASADNFSASVLLAAVIDRPSSCTVKDSNPSRPGKVGRYGCLLWMSSHVTLRVLTPAPT
jgi:hypothetical protein